MSINSKDTTEYVLMDNQLGIYLECVDESNPATYLIPLSFYFPAEKMDENRLADAFAVVARAYSAFSTVIRPVNAQPVMAKYEKELPRLPVIPVGDEEVRQHETALFTPFSFDGNLLWRGEILKTPTQVVLALVIHHTIFDGTSIAVLNQALAKAYNGDALCEGNSLFDAQISERNMLAGKAAQEANEYFERYMDGLEGDSNIIPDKVPEGENLPATADYAVSLTEGEVRAFAEKNNVTENVVFLSAFSYALSKFNNQKEAVFSSVESGRYGGGYENSIGMFVKSFPLRFAVDEQMTSSEYAKSVKKSYFDTLKHNHTKYSELVKTYSGCGDVHFIYLGEMFRGIPVNGVAPSIDVLGTYEPVSNLDILVYKSNHRYMIWLGYKDGIYSKAMMDCFVDLYLTVLREMIQDKKLCDFDLISAESLAFIDEGNRTESPYDETLTVNGIFKDVAARYPENIAVSCRNTSLSYAELDAVTDRLGAAIHAKGIGKDDYVSVLIPRNEYMAICALGIIKAGAAYQPLDPTYPPERLNYMVDDSGARLLIADRSLAHLLSDYHGIILYTDEIEMLPQIDDFSCQVEPDNAFTLIYTSGTTGKPKGCILENRNIVAFHMNHRESMELSDTSKVATVASFGFDAGVMDLFTTLMSGGELCIIPDERKLDIPWVEKYYQEKRITNGFMTTQLGRMFLEQTECKTLKHFILGGEKLVPFTPPQWVVCHNGYGPSETLAYICSYVIQNNSIIQPIGKSSGNTKLYIVDSENRLLPPGAAGELCISGLQVGRGYHNRPEKTAEVFVKNPFCSAPGYERLYRTGDIVRMLPDGNFDFIGRRDGQVKIRGFRIELTEIEQVIREFEGIKNATVQAYDDAVSGKFVGAFIVADEPVDVDRLHAFILSRKPPYMVPAVTMQIDSIPVNVNGKVDKKKLPKPERKFEEVVKPENGTQQAIFDLAASVIGTEEFGVDTDFYLAGLSSIGSIKLCSLLAEKFERVVQMKDLRQNNTVRKLEALLCTAEAPTAHELLADYPLTKTQEGIFVECTEKPDSTFYNIPLLLKLSPKIDIKKLKAAIADTVNAHPYLKTELFTNESGNIRQKRVETGSFTADDIAVITGKTEEEIRASAVTPFALMNERLFRFKLFCGAENYLFLEIHHIIADGTSINILLSDIEKAYAGETLPTEAYNSFDLALDEEQRRSTGALAEAKNYYASMLEGLDNDFLPGADKLMSAPKDSGKLSMGEMIARGETVQEYCSKNRISVNGLLCSAFGFVLAKYAGTEYAVFNTVYNGRNDPRTAATVGMLVKTLPVVCSIEKQQSLDLAKEVTAQLIDSMSNDLYSFAEICNSCGVRNDVIFVYQGDNFNFNSFCGEASEELEVDLSESKAPVAMQVALENGQLRYIVEYDPDLFTESLMRTFVCAFDKAVASFVKGEAIAEISLLTDEMEQTMDAYNRTEFAYDAKTIPELYAEQAKQHPQWSCVVYKEKTYTYREAFDQSCRIAAHLNSKGVAGGDVVAILIHRDENMVFAGHGVVMSGAAYVGLDPTYPQERLNFMVKDSGAKLVIADRTLKDLLDEYDGEFLFTDEFETLPPVGEDFEAGQEKITPENPAIVIYSSGTTGVPKGSVLSHGNIICFYQNYTRDMDIHEGSRVAMYASFGFDGGAMDVFCPPMAGATLYIIPSDIRLDLEKLEQFYVQNRITSGFMTTQVGTMFISNTRCRSLTHFQVGGEKFIPTTAPEWVTFYNGYGPSETMCYVNNYQAVDLGTLQPIGKANRNIKEYILDQHGNRLPIGACGELCISGGQTGQGYLNRPEKTAQAFVSNPFCGEKPYDRMYKTGDIVRMLPDGNYVFEGRRDGQVKIRGFRVELTEIEQVIREFAGIRTAAVQAFDSSTGGKYLAAYVVSGEKVDISALNAFIASKKPDYMVPAMTVQIDEIPLTSNGKVDRKKLPKPAPTLEKKGAEPANETEESICSIFEEVLGLEKVYADDDFFKIGGSSISAIKAVVKCSNAGYNIVFKNLFANPTPHSLSAFILNRREETVYAPGEGEAEKYDYSALAYNTLEHVNEIHGGEIGDVLLTGATGFLGSHILKELLDNTAAHVLCLVRSKGEMSAETRFQMMMTYYFEDWYSEVLRKRVTVIDGGLGDREVLQRIKSYHFDTIINSAANVKHFVAGNELLKDNFSGVENLIRLAEETKTLLVQISSTSVSGEAVEGKVSDDFLFRENQLNIGQSLENKYVYSKYQAEQAVIDAVSRGKIRGKIIRLGNLMARMNDSEFQINAGSNSFLKQFSAYRKLAMFPVDQMDKPIEFSPIDSVAKAVVLLSGTPDQFTVFHAKNCNDIHYGYLINAMKKEGLDIQVVSDELFAETFDNAMKEENGLAEFAALIAYRDNDRGDGKARISHQIESDATFTTKALYRLGFAWPLISSDYLEKMVKTLIDLGFFD